jgi:hypothetical protein
MKTISDRAAKLRLAPNRSEPASIWPPCEDSLHLNSTRNFRQTADQHDILVSKRKRLTTYRKSFACPNNTYSKDRRLTPSLLLSKVTGSRYCNFQHTSVEVVQRYPTGNHMNPNEPAIQMARIKRQFCRSCCGGQSRTNSCAQLGSSSRRCEQR